MQNILPIHKSWAFWAELCTYVAQEMANGLETETNEAAEFGTRCHAYLAEYCEGKRGKRKAARIRKRIEREESAETVQDMLLCFDNGVAWFDNFMAQFPGGKKTPIVSVERYLSVNERKAAGTLDIIVWDHVNKRVYVIDWKTGRKRTDFQYEAHGYTYLAWETFEPDRATFIRVWLRFADEDRYEYDSSPEPFISAKREEFLAAEPIATPNEYCEYCPLNGRGCPAQDELLPSQLDTHSTLAPFMFADFKRWFLGGEDLAVESRIGIGTGMALLEGLMKQNKKRLKILVEKTGDLETPIGTWLIRHVSSPKIEALEASRIMVEGGLSWANSLAYLNLSAEGLKRLRKDHPEIAAKLVDQSDTKSSERMWLSSKK